jgi:hypothetical protein
MRLLLSESNLDEFFQHRIDMYVQRGSGYAHDVSQIRLLLESSTQDSIESLVEYLRPWSIEEEGGFMYRELLRLIAMQTLCYMATMDSDAKHKLESIFVSNDSRWTSYEGTVWGGIPDTYCLPKPYEDFLRCLKEVLECAEYV